uniref:Protein krueppel n=1 Tax=Anopheles dirus TaxID=7168 RepID=A0A182NCY1_9DIPT
MSLCRACLHPEADVYLSLFAKVDQVPLEQMFHTLTGLSVSREDGLPRYVCQECSNGIVAFSNFRQKCIESDERLHILLNTPEDIYSQSTEPEGTEGLQQDSTLENEANLIVKEEIYCEDNDLYEEKLHTKADSLTIEPVHQNESHSEQHDVLDEVEAEGIDIFDSSADEKSVEIEDIDTDNGNQHSSEEVSPMEERHNQELSICCGCPKMQFASSAELMQHSADVHRKERVHNNVRPYECHICFNRFISHAWLVQHQQNPYREKKFACKHHLRAHQNVHTGKRTLKCRHCDKCFAYYTDRRVHEFEHENIHLHQCTHCAKTYSRNFKLQDHIRRVHTGERPFACTECADKFFQRCELTAHQRVAHGKSADGSVYGGIEK